MPSFDAEEAGIWESLLPAPPTLFPLTPEGTPAGRWGALEAGEQIPAESDTVGYGLACGSRSGGLVVLDLDVKGGHDGPGALRALEARWGALPETLTVRTPSGGTHLYFRHTGKFQSNASKIGPGIDVRAEGGYVRIPGSPPGYTLVRAVRPAELPAAWASGLPRAGSAPAAPAPEAAPVDPETLREALGRAAHGKHGPGAAAWRAIAKGERFVRVRGGAHGPEVPADFGGVDDFLTRGILGPLALAGEEWLRVSEADFLALIGPSLSILQADDARAGNKIYTESDLVGKWTRAKEWAAGRAEAARKSAEWARELVARIHGALPLLVAFSGTAYVRTLDPPFAYIGPKLRSDLWVTCRDVWGAKIDIYRPTARGQVRMSPDDLIEVHGQAVDRVVHDVSASEPSIVDRALILPTAKIAVQPAYHADVEAWLQSYDPGGSLHDWIAILTDLKYAAPALWLTGAPKIGKSLLARGLAKVWGGSPTPMVRAFAEFNDSMLQCPLVEAAEEIPRNSRGYQDTERLKELISATERKINEKHKPIRDVLGAVRVIMSSNNTNLIRNASDLTAEDAAALAERFVHIHVDATRAVEIRAKLPSPRTIQDVWIDGGRVAEHALYLAKNRTVAFGPRLRMAPNSTSLYGLFVTQPGAGFGVCAAVYRWVVAQARSIEAGEPLRRDDAVWAHGTVCFSAAATHALMDEEDRRGQTKRSVGQALRRLSHTDERIPVNGKRLWPIDLTHVRSWCKEEGWGDAHELDRAIKVVGNGR